MKKEIRQPKGNIKAGFSPRKTGDSGFYAKIYVIRKYRVISAPIRPVTRDRQNIEYALIEP